MRIPRARGPLVYGIRNMLTGRIYVGSTIRPLRKRIDHHLYCFRRSSHANTALQHDYQTQGAHTFTVVVLEQVTDRAILRQREAYWYEQFGPVAYNIIEAKDGVWYEPEVYTRRRATRIRFGWQQPDANRQAASKRMSDYNARRWADPVARKRQSDLNKARSQTDQHQERLKNWSRKLWNDPSYCAMKAEENRQRWADPAHKARMGEFHAKLWLGLIAPDGTIHRNIRNMGAFAREHSMSAKQLRQLANGEGQSYKGWKRIEVES